MRTIWRVTGGNQGGSVFIISLVLIGVMTMLGVALFDLAGMENEMSIGDRTTNQLLYCAEGALGRTMIDSNGRMGQISSALLTPGATLTWSDTTKAAGTSCATTVVFTDDTVKGRRMLQATSTAPNGVQRSVRAQLNFLPLYFQFTMVAAQGDLYLGGAGAAPSSGPGGADVINGDVFINGKVYVGSPSVTCSGGSCTATAACAAGTDSKGNATTCSSSPQVNARSLTDTTSTVSVLTASTQTQAQADHSSAWPTSGDGSPFGKRANVPTPDVAGYVTALQTAVGSSMTGTYQGSPVYNLAVIFSTLGRNTSDGSLKQPSGCGCSGTPTGNCGIYCQLAPLAIKMNAPGTRADLTSRTAEDDFFVDGVTKSSEQCTTKPYCGHDDHNGNLLGPTVTGDFGAQAVMDFTGVSSQPPVLLASGNVWFNNTASKGWEVDGRAMVVATNDVYMGDNLLYKNGVGEKDGSDRSIGCPAGSTNAACVPATADMLGIIAARDIWYGDPIYGTFHEASAIMLAGRDFNFAFFDAGGNPKTPVGPFILNGTMLANRQIAVFRDFANPTDANATCPAETTTCQPIAFDPTNTSCGSSVGCWRFLLRNATTGVVTFDTTKSAFKECAPNTVTCPSSSREITHYQMTVNYDPRLFANPMLQAPALSVQVLTGLPGANFGNSWRNWQECPPCT